MKLRIINLLFTLSLVTNLMCASCATGPSGIIGEQEQRNEIDLVWPPPPDTPRIRFVQVIKTPADVGIKAPVAERFMSIFAGRKEAYLNLPQQIAIGPNGSIYVTDQKLKCVHVFDVVRKRYFAYKGFGKRRFYSPSGVAVAGNGWVYVSDSISKKISVFDSKGRPLFDFGGPDVFQRPTGMVFLPEAQRLYVADTLAHNLKVFDKEGSLLFQIGGRGEEGGNFNYPAYISSDMMERIYVTDTMNHRVQVLDMDGNLLTAFGKAGDKYGSFAKPKGIAADSQGNIYVVDALHDAVQIFNEDGQLLLSFCGPGSGKGELWLPSGIAIDTDDRIYVTDTYNKRIQVFDLVKQSKDSR
jgi:DNA-binding beta-propeller fold protein YncE